jgi:uncharacterized membrane protein YdjX (TVP38/TMEM64 family)
VGQITEHKPPNSNWARYLIVLLILAALIVPLILWKDQIRAMFVDPQRLTEAVRSAGPWAPLVFIGLYIAQAVAAPIPGQALNFAAGYLFGLIPGILYSWLGLILGTTAALLLARYAGRPLVRRLVNPAALDKMDRLAASRGLGFFFLVFLLPGLPDDIACFVAGLTLLPIPALIAASAIGRLPSIVASVWLGVYAQRLPWQGWFVLGGLTLAVALAAWRYGERIQDVALKWLARRS